MENLKSPDVTREKPLLSVLVASDPEKPSFHDYIRDTLNSFNKEYGTGDQIQVVVAFPQANAEAERLLREASKGAAVDVATEDQLEETVRGEYVAAIEAGDMFYGEGLRKLLGELSNHTSGVYEVIAPKEERPGREETVRMSIFAESELPVYPRGVVIARSVLQDPLKELLPGDMRACGVCWKAALADRGYIRLNYDAFHLIHNHPSFFDYAVIPEVMQSAIDFSIERYGCVEDFLQTIIVGMFRRELDKHGSAEEVRQLLPYIDDENIMAKRRMGFLGKLCLLDMKHGKPILPECTMMDAGQLMLGDTQICTLGSRQFKVDIIEIADGMITFRGRTELHLLGDRYKIFITSSKGKRKYIDMIPFPPFNRVGLDGEVYYEGRRFEVTVPVRTGQSYMFFVEDDLGRTFQLAPRWGNYSGFVDKAPFSYFSRNGIIVTNRGGTLSMHEYTKKRYRKNEIEFLKYLIHRKRYAVAGYRILYHLDRIFSRKPIWILADRPHVAGDNGEHMFRYLQTTDAVKKNDIYFLIKEESPDYQRMKKIGKVLKYGSVKHKVKFLQAQAILCAAANDLATNALGKSGHFYRDFYNFDFVYLRHGVSHNDQSRWINRLNKNIKVLVATCRPEYEGILNGPYDYTPQEVKLTGLPRFDNLYDESEKKIAILPTWRKDIQGEVLNRSSQRDYVGGFKDTDYYIFYDSLIHDERLLAAMEKYGYEGVFYLHPAFEAQLEDFTSSRRITVGSGVADYQKVFRESAIMVTDYSSVAFDFAYLKKPVIYSQFDEDTFYQNHSWGKGYFTYREDGFGPITNTVEQTVDELIYYMENGAKMKQEYVDKVDNFFAYTDRHNCERVYHAVLEDVERKNR